MAARFVGGVAAVLELPARSAPATGRVVPRPAPVGRHAAATVGGGAPAPGGHGAVHLAGRRPFHGAYPYGEVVALHHYEMMVCFRPDLDEEAAGALPQRLQTMIGNQGGEVTKENSMGRRRLAYPIRHFHEGLYQVVNFQMPPENVMALDHQLLLDDNVLRHLVIREGD